jgi:hypothetical protein
VCCSLATHVHLLVVLCIRPLGIDEFGPTPYLTLSFAPHHTSLMPPLAIPLLTHATGSRAIMGHCCVAASALMGATSQLEARMTW